MSPLLDLVLMLSVIISSFPRLKPKSLKRLNKTVLWLLITLTSHTTKMKVYDRQGVRLIAPGGSSPPPQSSSLSLSFGYNGRENKNNKTLHNASDHTISLSLIPVQTLHPHAPVYIWPLQHAVSRFHDHHHTHILFITDLGYCRYPSPENDAVSPNCTTEKKINP